MYISNFGLGQDKTLNAQCRNKYWWSGSCDVALMSGHPFWCSDLSSASVRYSLIRCLLLSQVCVYSCTR